MNRDQLTQAVLQATLDPKPFDHLAASLISIPVEQVTAQVASCALDELKAYKSSELQRIREIGLEGIEYWEGIRRHYATLSREEAIAKLIRAEKIDAKISVIRRAIAREPRI